MNLLLDTHALLWWLTDDPQLSDTARALIADPDNRVLVSAASAWEIAIKCGTGKLTLPEPPTVYVPARIAANGFEPLPIRIEHVLRTYDLPMHHRDPFDRLLIAQSVVEDVPLVTADSAMAPYPAALIW